MTTLEKTRTAITKVQAEIAKYSRAFRPVAEIEADLRIYLQSLADPRRMLVDQLKDIIAHGHRISSLVEHGATSLTKHAYGLALAAHGTETLLAEAMEQAALEDTGRFRLPELERDEKLQALREKLYALELDEEAMLDGAERRSDANPAAVLGIPLEVAIDYEWLK